MKSYIGEITRRLLELHALEERLSVFQRDHKKVTDAQLLIDSLRANLPKSVLSCHDRLRVQGKRSVAEVRRDVCSACHMKVSTGLLVALRRLEALEHCENCGRYLYLVEEEEDVSRPVVRRGTKRLGAVQAA